MMRFGQLIAATTVAGLVCASAAQAVAWSVAAASCTPTPETILNNRIWVQGGHVRHQPDVTDTVTVICGLQDIGSITNQNTLRVTYRDSTGNHSRARLRIRIAGVSRTTGEEHTKAIFSSDSWSDTNIVERTAIFPGTFNFATHYYYLRADLSRTAASEVVIFYGFVLDYTAP